MLHSLPLSVFQRLSKIILCLSIGAFLPHVGTAAPLFWDANGTTAGAGAAPTGTWGSSSFWNSDSTGGASGSFTATTTSSDNLTFVAAAGAGSGSSAFSVSLSGNQAANGITVSASGGITLGDSSTTISLGGGGLNTLTAATGANSVNSKISLQADQTWSLVRGVTFNEVISGTGNLTITGNSTKTFNAANTYNGTTTLSGGGTNVLSFAGTGGSLGSGNFVYDGGTVQFNHTADVTFSNNISGVGGSGMTKFGSTTLTLAGSNANPTLITVRGGAISVNAISKLGTSGSLRFGAVGSADSGALRYTGAGESTALQLNMAGNASSSMTLQNNGSGALVFTHANPITVASGNKLVVLQGSNSDNNEIKGAIVNSTGVTSLSKSENGKWILSGSNTYTGQTLVTAGTLLINGSLGASAVTASNSAVFGGSGTIAGSLSMTNSSSLAPGDGVGILTVNSSASFSGSSTLSIQLNGTTAGTGYDQLMIGGAANNVTLTGGAVSLSLALGYSPQLGDSFILVNNSTAGLFSGTFSNLAPLGTMTLGAVTFTANDYGNGVANNDLILTITSVPEPTITGLLALGLMAMTVLRRRSSNPRLSAIE